MLHQIHHFKKSGKENESVTQYLQKFLVLSQLLLSKAHWSKKLTWKGLITKMLQYWTYCTVSMELIAPFLDLAQFGAEIDIDTYISSRISLLK